MNTIKGKKFIITGATSGIGREIAKSLGRLGASLILVGRNKSALVETLEELGVGDHATLTIDLLQNPASLSVSIKELAKSTGPVDGGVYCAGVNFLSPLVSFNSEQFSKMMRVNVEGAIFMAQGLASRDARTLSGGSIVFISSVAGIRGEKGASLYGCSKAALVSLSKSLALELAKFKIRVNCISPGWVKTPMGEKMARLYAGGEEKLQSTYPLKVGEVQNVSDAVLFLLSDAASWITGTNLIVDGGYSI